MPGIRHKKQIWSGFFLLGYTVNYSFATECPKWNPGPENLYSTEECSPYWALYRYWEKKKKALLLKTFILHNAFAL